MTYTPINKQHIINYNQLKPQLTIKQTKNKQPTINQTINTQFLNTNT
jgi:hypothetical protein